MTKIARVQMADGRIARIEVPDDYTPQQAMAAAQQFSGAPKAPAKASAKPSMLKDLASGFSPKTMLSNLNEAVIGGAEGIYNAASAVTDPIVKKAIGLIYDDDSANASMQSANRSRRRVSDAASGAFVDRPNPVARGAGRIAGSLAIPLPGKKLQEGGKLARGAYRAMQGAVGGAAVRDVDEGAGTPAAIGAATNMALPPILRWAANTRPGQAVGNVIGQAAKPVLNYLTGGAPEAIAAPTAQRALAPLGRKAEARAARFKKLGVENPTTGMVTRDPNAFSFEQNTSKIAGGEDLQRQMRGVEDTLVERGKQLVRDHGGARSEEATGKGVQEALDSKRGEMQEVTGRWYRKMREERGDDEAGTLEGLRGLMGHPDMADNAVLDDMATSLNRRLERLGLVGKDGVSTGAPTTVKQAEELRKFIGGLGNTADPTVRMMRRNLIDALDDDVVGAVGDDPFKVARASAKARFDEFQKTFAGKIADEGIAPERLTKRVLSDTTSLKDLRALKQSLHSGTEAQIERGKEAWRGLRGQALGDLMGKSIDADGRLVGSKLATEFTRQGQQEKWRELLDPADYKELRRLVMATRDVKAIPQGHSVNTSNSAITFANLFQQAKPAVREGFVKFYAKMFAKHGAAAAISFPAGNFALVIGENITGTIAQRRAAALLARQIGAAQGPERAAAIEAAAKAAKSNPFVSDILQKYGAATGGLAAEAGNSR